MIFIISCKNNPSTLTSSQNRDSLMKKYFLAVDSLPYLDSLDLNFRLLKAYYNNDTNFINKSLDEVTKVLKRHRNDTVFSNLFYNQPPLDSLNFKEGYRFNYDAAFCTTAVTITIGKHTDSIIMDIFLFDESVYTERNWKIINHFTKKLNKKDWDDLIRDLDFADFWALKETNDDLGLDGSNLRVEGYQRPVNAFMGNYQSIYRWTAEETAMGVTFKRLLDLSGIKVECFHFR